MTAIVDGIANFDGAVRWFALAVVAVGSAAALGGALFSLLAGLLRVRDTSLPLLGRLIGVLVLLWLLGESVLDNAQRMISGWWREELHRSNDAHAPGSRQSTSIL